MKVTELSSEAWAGLLKAARSATIFHSNEWLTVLERTYGCEIHRLGILDDGHLIGGIPVVVKKKFIYRIAGSPASSMVTPYQGLLCVEPSKYAGSFEAFWCYADSMGWDFVHVIPPPDNPTLDWRWTDSRIQYEPKRTIYIDLTLGEAKVFQQMDPDHRNQVRQADRRGATCREIDTSRTEWLEPYYELSAELYRRQGRPPAIPKAFFENLADVLGGTSRMKLVLATFGQEVVAGGIFLIHEGTVYFWDGVSRRAYNHLRPNHLIQWAVIRWAIQQGLWVYDMLGANIPSIAAFKKGFGGRVVPYGMFQRSKDWRARFGERGYRSLAPLARRVASALGK